MGDVQGLIALSSTSSSLSSTTSSSSTSSSSSTAAVLRCPHCVYVTVNRYALLKHIRLVHDRHRPFVCHVCSKAFGQKVHLETHVHSVHIKMRPHECSECGYRSTTKGQLMRHTRTVHRNERPFTCHVCKTTFGQKTHLQKHINNVHNKHIQMLREQQKESVKNKLEAKTAILMPFLNNNAHGMKLQQQVQQQALQSRPMALTMDSLLTN